MGGGYMKYVGYIRVSTDEQVSGYGLEAQRSAITNYAQLYGLEVEKIISDEGKSGKDFNREGIQEIIEGIKVKKYLGVIVFKLDRISRNLKDILIFHDDIFVPADAHIISVKEQFDTSTPVGRLLFQMIGGFAEFERETIKQRMSAGREEKAQKGIYAGGAPPYGYKAINGELVPDEQEANVINRIFALRESEKSLQEIANHLNQVGVPTKHGNLWSKSQLKYILDREEFYKGTYRYSNIVTKGRHQPILKIEQ
jgi:site-specific DNA recombinase